MAQYWIYNMDTFDVTKVIHVSEEADYSYNPWNHCDTDERWVGENNTTNLCVDGNTEHIYVE